MSNSVVPESASRGDQSARSVNEKHSLSEQLLADLSPKVSFHDDMPSRMHVNDFTPGDIIGNESNSKLPPLKGKEAAFIPLHLAKDYVKKMENDMKAMHNHYKDMLLELEKCYAGIESDIHKKYKDFIQKYKVKMDEKCKNLKKAYDEEHKLREELRTWAEANVVSLQEKLKDEGEGKMKALEQLDKVIAGGEKDKENYLKSLENDFNEKIEKVKNEKSKIERDLMVMSTKVKNNSLEIGKLIVELVVQKAEFVIFKDKSTGGPVAAVSGGKSASPVPAAKDDNKVLKAENDNLKQANKTLKKEIAALREALAQPRPAEIDPSILQENEKLKQRLEKSKRKHKQAVTTLTSEKENIQKELQLYTQKISAPAEGDDVEKQMLKAQIAAISVEISNYRQKLSEEEGKSSQVESLKSALTEKDQEISKLIEKISNFKPVIVPAASEDSEPLHLEISKLKKQIEELTQIPSTIIAAKPGDDKEKKELKSLIKKLQKQNDYLKTQIEENKSDDLKILRESLDEANRRLQIYESKSDLSGIPKPPKVKKLGKADDSQAVSDLEAQLLIANQKIEFLQKQEKNSGVSQTDELMQLNLELTQANARIAELTLLAAGSEKSDSSELQKELAKLKSENQTLKSNAPPAGQLKSLQDELNSRPKAEDLAKLNEIIKNQEKQLKESSSSQSQQTKTLNDEIARLKQTLEIANKDSADQIAKINKDYTEVSQRLQKQVNDLDAVRQQLEKQLKAEVDSKGKMAVELEQVKKVAGEAAALGKKVEELSVALAALQEKNAAKEQELKDSIRQRKLLHNQLEDLKGKIRVFCRVRPLSKSELDKGCLNITTVVDEFTITCESKNGVKPFVYDSVFGPNSTQEEVFEDTKRVVQSAVDGYNVCVFAYGQTGSGKTYTMTGVPSSPGVTPRAMDELFEVLNHLPKHYRWEVSCYMVELYLDTLVDLFLPKEQRGNPPPLTIKKDTKGIVNIPEAVKVEVRSSREIMAKFEEGNLMRHTSSTKMNDSSSRSHLIFGVLIDVTNGETNQRTVGKLSLVDLAGSERVSKTEATAERLKEGRAINKSLTALGDVISALSSNESHIPYRNNKLTMLMSDSLGGSAKTLMFVNVSPANYNQEETTMSLFYAARVKMIINDPTKNVESKEMTVMKNELFAVTAERDKMKAFLEAKGFSSSNLTDIPESRNEDYNDAKYDDL